MKIATWNVNSIRVRLPHVKDFLNTRKPDVMLLQELKAQDNDMPASDLEDLGYNVIFKGQKAYNGVAILSKHPISDIITNLYSDENARYIECWIDAKNSGFRVASIYLPNGNPINTEKFSYKIEWMSELSKHVKKLLDNEEKIIKLIKVKNKTNKKENTKNEAEKILKESQNQTENKVSEKKKETKSSTKSKSVQKKLKTSSKSKSSVKKVSKK